MGGLTNRDRVAHNVHCFTKLLVREFTSSDLFELPPKRRCRTHGEGFHQMPVTPPTKCPRCKGMMLNESDAHSVYSSCLSCGYVYEENIISVFELEREQAVEEGRQRRRQPSHGKLRL